MDNLFELVRESAYRKMTGIEKFDGKAFWQSIKHYLDDNQQYSADGVVIHWLPIECATAKWFLALPEFDEQGQYGHNHFSIQQVRIPKMEHCSIRKIIHVALNVGFAQAVGAHCYEVYLRSYVSYVDIQLFDELLEQVDLQPIKDLL